MEEPADPAASGTVAADADPVPEGAAESPTRADGTVPSDETAWRRWGAVRRALSIPELMTLVGIAVLPLASGPWFYADAYLVKLAVAFLVAGVGVVPLASLVRRGDRPALAALVFLVAVWAAVLAAPHPGAAATGGLNGFSSGMLFTVFVLAWATGRSLGDAGRTALAPAALAGVLATAAIIWLQGFGVEDWLFIPRIDGRPGALVGNPVFAGSLLAGALALLVGGLDRRPRRASSLAWPVAGIALLAGALNISGGRISSIAGLLGVAVACARLERRLVLVTVAAVLLGIGLSFTASTTGATGATGRATAEPGRGLPARADMWKAGLDALQERPLLGWGPGRFHEATGPRITEAFTRHESPGARFADAHNLVVELAVATGAVGLVAGLWWLWELGRTSHGRFAVAGFAAVVSLLLQPLTVHLVWALVVVGAANPVPAWDAPRRRRAAALPIGVGAALAAVVLAAGVLMRTAFETGSVEAARRAGDLLPTVPEPLYLEYRSELTSIPPVGPARDAWLDRLRDLADRSIDADPALTHAWLIRGQVEAYDGHFGRAVPFYLEALRWNPQDPHVLHVVERAAARAGNWDLRDEVRAHRCRILPSAC